MKWKAHNDNEKRAKSLVSELEIKGGCDRKFINKSEFITVSSENYFSYSLEISNNVPYYEVRVRMRVKDSKEVKWSEWRYADFYTDEKVPIKTPEMAGYTVHNDHIYVFWREMPRCQQNGNGFTYLIQLDQSESIYKTGSELFFKVQDSSNEMKFHVWSQNNKGQSKKKSSWIVPESSKRNNDLLFVHKNTDGAYHVNWGPPKNTENIKSYSVFWCKPEHGSPDPCKDSFNLRLLPRNYTSFRWPSHDPDFSFAVAINYENYSSSMKWYSADDFRDFVIRNQRAHFEKCYGENPRTKFLFK